jgi:hypothetical protein
MMALTYEEGLLVYFLVWLCVLAFLWGREIWRIQKYDWSQHADRLCVCEGCQLAFMIRPDVNITRCPRCNQMCILRSPRKY